MTEDKKLSDKQVENVTDMKERLKMEEKKLNDNQLKDVNGGIHFIAPPTQPGYPESSNTSMDDNDNAGIGGGNSPTDLNPSLIKEAYVNPWK